MTAFPARPSAASGTGLDLVAVRQVVTLAPLTWFPLLPGDRTLVAVGDEVMAGTPLAEVLNDRRLIDVPMSATGNGAQAGNRWAGDPRRGAIVLSRGPGAITGELLFAAGSQWRVASGEQGGLLEAPTAGVVREVRPGVGIAVQVTGAAINGIRALGTPARGPLDVATGGDGDTRAGGLDVGRAGAILVVGGRVDAETLTRARAMGIRGMVVGSLSAGDLRDFAASEARQRASLHRLPPFGVLVLDGTVRRAVPSPVRASLAALAGQDVAITDDPPQLLFDPTAVRLPTPASDLVRVRQGAWGGREGHWVGLAGPRQFRGAVWLEAGFVRFESGEPVALPLADLERFA